MKAVRSQTCTISLNTYLCRIQSLKTDAGLSLQLVILTFIQNEQLWRNPGSFYIQLLSPAHLSTLTAVGFMWSLEVCVQFLTYQLFTLEITWVYMHHLLKGKENPTFIPASLVSETSWENSEVWWMCFECLFALVSLLCFSITRHNTWI